MKFMANALSVLLLCSAGAPAPAQSQTAEYGSPGELKDVAKIFIDTGTDLNLRDDIAAEIHKKLRDLKFASKPEESDVHLRFAYETHTAHGGSNPQGVILKTPVGTVVKVLGKDRVLVLMSFKPQRAGVGISIGFGGR